MNKHKVRPAGETAITPFGKLRVPGNGCLVGELDRESLETVAKAIHEVARDPTALFDAARINRTSTRIA